MHPLVLALQLTVAATGQGFAEALMREGDYFRAITEYKRELFSASDAAARQRCLLEIARAYRKSSKYASAVQYAGSLLGDSTVAESRRRSANLELGISYLEWGRAVLGAPFLRAAAAGDSSGFAALGLALVDLECDRPARAAAAFREIAGARRESAERSDLLDLALHTELFARAPTTSPALATTLSFVIPGSGQVYSGHLYDGLQAFAFVSAFALATVAVYQYEHHESKPLRWTYVGASVTSLFHAANLFGANRTANYRNWRRRIDFNRAARDRVMRYEPEADAH